MNYGFSTILAQCQQFSAVFLDSSCDNAGTLNDPSDDTFTAKVYVDNGLNPIGTWSSNDGSYTNQAYPPFVFEFGPYLLSNGDVTIVITDDQIGCNSTVLLVAPAPCSDPPVTCPDFDLCYQLFDSDNCTVTYAVTLNGELETHDNIGPIYLSWFTNGGIIESVSFFDEPNNPLALGGVTITGNSAMGGSNMDGFEIVNTTPHFLITVSAEPGSCVQLDDGLIGIVTSGVPCVSTETLCTDPEEFCATGIEVTGNVTAPGQIYDCPDTENHGIEGAEISITTPSGESCSTTTKNDGSYACTFCDEGPYTICVDTRCEEPCGVTDYDLVLFRDYILGRKAWTKEFWMIGDVNGSGTASTLDLVLIQREILGLDSTTIENWCRFVPVEDIEQAPAPNATISSDSLYAATDNCITTTEPWISTDFVRLMVGDFDGSCTDCIHGDGEGNLPIVIDDDKENNRSWIKSTVNDKIHALTLHIPIPNGVEVLHVNSVLSGYEYAIKDGEVHFIWLDLTEDNVGFETTAGQILVEIETDVPSDVYLTDQENYWLSRNHGIKKITNSVEPRSSTSGHSIQVLTINNLHQIEIQPLNGESTISIYDAYGRRLSTKRIDLSTHNIDADLPIGIYILSIEDKIGIQSQKVFISK